MAANARIAALTGVLFAGLFAFSLVLIHQAPGLASSDHDYTDFYSKGSGNVLVTAGVHIVPFAGIAFLWHMAATRVVIEALPGPPSGMPRWLQLASGVLWTCMVFAGTAAVGAVALLTVFTSVQLPPPDVARAFMGAGYGMVFVFGVRAAGMYMFTTTTLSLKRAMLPRWAAWLSYLAATFLLLSTTFHPAILLVFPAWVVLFSACLMWSHGRPTRP